MNHNNKQQQQQQQHLYSPSTHADKVKKKNNISVCTQLKCYYDQILDIHFFTFPYTIGLS